MITTNVDGIGPFEIPVRQEGTPDYLSTIETDVDLGILSRSRGIASVNDDRRDDPRTMWDLILWDESIEYDFVGNFTGTGNKFCCKLYTEPIRQNDDNEYFLPNGTYTVTPETANPENPDLYYVAGEMEQGKWGYSHPAFPTGTWYIRMANDEVTGDVCISGGTLTVTRSGEEYTMTFDLTSDAGRKVTGSYRGTLNNSNAREGRPFSVVPLLRIPSRSEAESGLPTRAPRRCPARAEHQNTVIYSSYNDEYANYSTTLNYYIILFLYLFTWVADATRVQKLHIKTYSNQP